MKVLVLLLAIFVGGCSSIKNLGSSEVKMYAFPMNASTFIPITQDNISRSSVVAEYVEQPKKFISSLDSIMKEGVPDKSIPDSPNTIRIVYAVKDGRRKYNVIIPGRYTYIFYKGNKYNANKAMVSFFLSTFPDSLKKDFSLPTKGK